jgi:hypothetical protein
MTALRMRRRLSTLVPYSMLLLVPAALLYVSWQQLNLRGAEILRHRQTLGRLEALLARAEEIDRRLLLANSGQNAGLFLQAPSPAMMTARLQRQLQEIIAASQARFIRASEIPPLERDGITYAGIRLELSGSVESLARTVASIESVLPMLFVERAEFGGDLGAAHRADRPPVHTLKIDVVAPVQLPQPAANGGSSP